MDLSFADIKRLSELLKPEEESSDSEDDLPKTGFARFGPGHIGQGKKESKVTVKGTDPTEEKKNVSDEKTIWDDAEIPEGIVHDESEDPRQKPEFEIKYKQAVTAEEMFLHMGQKTPATASCEEMIVDILLPGENKDMVDLNVLPQILEVRSPKYRLSLPLPHPVSSDRTKAVWDSAKLIVTLKMKRELDFANF